MSFLKTLFGKSKTTAIAFPPTSSSRIELDRSWSYIKYALSSPTEHHETLEDSLLSLHLDQLALALSSPSPDDSKSAPTLDYALSHDMPATLVALALPDQPPGAKALVLRFFLSLILFADPRLLLEPKLHKPLVRLLRSFLDPPESPPTDDDPGSDHASEPARPPAATCDDTLVELLSHLCSRIKAFPQLLSVFLQSRPSSSTPNIHLPSPAKSPAPSSNPRKSVHFSPQPSILSPSPSLVSSSHDDSLSHSTLTNDSSCPLPSTALDSDMFIFSHLLRFIHREGRPGDLARSGLLFLMHLAMAPTPQPSAEHVAFAEWVLDSDFADVLGAALGAAYGLLPSQLVITPRVVAHDHHVHPHATSATGMVLGSHLEDHQEDDQDAERLRRRNKVLDGLPVSGSLEFRSLMDLFLKLVEFAQDVLAAHQNNLLSARATIQQASAVIVVKQEEISGPTPSELVSSAISDTLLSSIKKLFLDAIVYPSILECSETDGSAVAVMSYLEAILSLVETDSELANALLRFLTVEDSVQTLAFSYNPVTSSRKRSNRRSGVMQLIEASYNRRSTSTPTGINYFTSLGRFTIKDLLVNHITSKNHPTATAALKLLNVIITRHDRFALGLLDIIPDPTATAFPFPTDTDLVDDADDGSEEEEEFTYPSISPPAHDDDEEQFVYPSFDGHEQEPGGLTTTPTKHTTRSTTNPKTHIMSTSTPATAMSKRISLLQRSPCPTYQSHRDGLDYVKSLIELIEPVVASKETRESSTSTAFEHYLQDAQTELTSTTTFRRGLLLLSSDHHGLDQFSSFQPSGHQPGISSTSKLTEWEAIDWPIIRHRISPNVSPILQGLTHSLRRFFAGEPEMNLILTGCLASLACCPTRSLQGWLLPQIPDDDDDETWTSRHEAAARDEGDDRSNDFVLDEIHSSYQDVKPSFSSISQPDLSLKKSQTLNHQDRTLSTILEIYKNLAEQVVEFRKAVPGFDKFLEERRDGLGFVENLEDALDSTNEKFLSPTTPTAANTIPSSPPPTTATMTTGAMGQVKQEAVNQPTFFRSTIFSKTPSNTSSRSNPTFSSKTLLPTSAHSNMQVVPPDHANSSITSTTSLQPFKDHYRQTRDIKLCISVPESSSSLLPTHREEGKLFKLMKETLNTSNASTTTSLSSKGEGPEQRNETIQVDLSTVLDNVVVLEESIKEIGAIICGRKALGIDVVRLF